MMPGRKPTKKELARMKALSDLGESHRSIARRLGKGHSTVKRYLNSEVLNDPAIGKMVEQIKEKEAEDLYLLGAKARKNLHDQADAWKLRPHRKNCSDGPGFSATQNHGRQKYRKYKSQDTVSFCCS